MIFEILAQKVPGTFCDYRRCQASFVLRISRWLLAAGVLGAVFIPRMRLGALAFFYRVDVRLEDLLLPVLGVFFLILSSRKISLAQIPAVEQAWLLFLIAAEISILHGFLWKTIDKPLVSLLYLLKWAEYFLVFCVTARLSGPPENSRFCFRIFLLLGGLAALYGWWEHFFIAGKASYFFYYRIYERVFPFAGDANHAGGLLILWTGFIAGIFLQSDKPSRMAWLLAGVILAFFPLVWTYSRKSYFSLTGMLTLAFLIPGSRKRALMLISALALLAFLFPSRLGARLSELPDALVSADAFHSSWTGNVYLWKRAFFNFDKLFLFGSGLGSRHRLVYESQYILVLAEMGIAGFAAWGILAGRLLREWILAVRSGLSREERGWALGWLLGTAGLCIHALSCVSFTVSKIAIPFWFLTGFVFVRLRKA